MVLLESNQRDMHNHSADTERLVWLGTPTHTLASSLCAWQPACRQQCCSLDCCVVHLQSQVLHQDAQLDSRSLSARGSTIACIQNIRNNSHTSHYNGDHLGEILAYISNLNCRHVMTKWQLHR